MHLTKQWEVHEVVLAADGVDAVGNPFADVDLRVAFAQGQSKIEVRGFYDGASVWRARVMPDATGSWTWRSRCNVAALDGRTGEFECGPAAPGIHGPVRVAHTHHFEYADGTRHLPFGTTCYAWIHQNEALQEETLRTLAASPFNKLRMCVFPKWYEYNRHEPQQHVFTRLADGTFDWSRPNLAYFQLLERRIADLGRLGLEADLILFHPYDHWGYVNMGVTADESYLRYVVARLASYRNVWWSLANEWDLIKTKQPTDWERLSQVVKEEDPYAHLRSIHNCMPFYDHTRPWITHVSAQRQDVYRTSENTDRMRNDYRKPVVWDEIGYEGDIEHGWGNLPSTELVRRYWEGMIRGGYVGHGETYRHPKDILWWSHGGQLHGQSAPRIAFLRRIVETCPGPGIEPFSVSKPGIEPRPDEGAWDVPAGGQPGRWILHYFGFNQPGWRKITLPKDAAFTIDIIDTWAMMIERLPGAYTGEVRVELPAKPYMAILVRSNTP